MRGPSRRSPGPDDDRGLDRGTRSSRAWTVPSQSGTGVYSVGLDDQVSCPCEDFVLRLEPCKHIIAARLVRARDHGGTSTGIVVDEAPKRPTYKQNWKADNAAQSVEKDQLQELLFDLCRGIEEPERIGMRGRKPHTLKDSLFAMAFKVYSPFSSRRFSSDLREAHARGHLFRPLTGLKVSEMMEKPHFTPLLKSLIVQSSLPLRAVETKFAIDSSGFATSKFERWFDHKYGVTRQKGIWVKCHLACGVSTHVVTAVRVLDKDSADSPQFSPLVRETAEGFTVEEVSATKRLLASRTLRRSPRAAGPGSSRSSRTTPGTRADCSRRCSTTSSTAGKSS